MTSPIDYTPTLALPYLAVGAPANQTRALTQQLAEEIEVILLDGVTGPAGADGADGAPGADGADGAPGVGVPTGGTTGQVLTKSSNTDYATAWTTPSTSSGSGTGPNRMMSGALYSVPGSGAAASAAAGTLFAAPFPIDVPPPSGVNALACRVNTAAASGVIALGVYADTGNGYPGAKVIDAGTVSAASTGDKYLTVSWSPTAGLYWLAFLVTGAATSVFHANPITAQATLVGPTGTALNAVSGPAILVTGQSALPSTFPTSSWTPTAAAPRVFVRTA